MKAIDKIFRFIIYTILTILVFINIIIFIKSVFFPRQVPSIFGYKPFIVMTDSMKDEFEKGDLVFSKVIKYDELEKGDIISYRDSKDVVITHRIINEVDKNGSICYIVKGDNNKTEDKGEVCSKQFEGKYVGKIARLGYLVLFIQEPFGFTLMMLIIVMICFIIYFSSGEKETIDEE